MKNSKIIIGVIALVVLVVIGLLVMRNDKDDAALVEKNENTLVQDEGMIKEADLPKTSEGAIDAYLKSTETLPSENTLDDGSYENIQ